MATQAEQPDEDKGSHESLVSTTSAPPSSDRNVDGATHSSDGRPEETSPSARCRFYDGFDSESSGDDVLVAKGDRRRATVPLHSQGLAPLVDPRYQSPPPTGLPARPPAPGPGQARPAQQQQQRPAGHPQQSGQSHGGPCPAAPWQHGGAQSAGFAQGRSQTPAPQRPQRQTAPPPPRAMTPGPAYGRAAGTNPHGAQPHGQAPAPAPGGQGASARGQTPAPSPNAPNQPRRTFFSRRF